MTTTEPPSDPVGASSTSERLMSAALQLIGDLGYHGATTRAIAAEAGVSEVTLFRRFGTKSDLTAAALAHATDEFRSVGAEPTGDVFADLVRLGQAYRRFVERRPGLVTRLLAEVAVESEIGVLVAGLIAGNAEAAAAVIEHHQRAGRLVDGPAGDILTALLGPILLGATIGGVHSPGTSRSVVSLDVAGQVTRFLAGHGA